MKAIVLSDDDMFDTMFMIWSKLVFGNISQLSCLIMESRYWMPTDFSLMNSEYTQ